MLLQARQTSKVPLTPSIVDLFLARMNFFDRVLVNAFNGNLFHKGIIDMYDLAPLLPSLAAGSATVSAQQSQLGRRINIELNFPANFEGLVLVCIDADFCK